jgi:cyclopropane-fatty-acyl-phospholipid synthase
VWVERIVDSGIVPELALRAGIRAICALRLREERTRDPRALIAELRSSEIAIETAAANAQHYEVPPELFAAVLGPHLKYSGCYWPAGTRDLAAAEAAMLELSCQRAQLADGQRVLDLGCGWGSLSLWAAERYPASQITAVSNSHAQRGIIEARARRRGLTNLRVITADVRSLELAPASFDRVVSIEMFEHMRNYAVLMRRIAGWLRPAGRLFVHVFAHARYAYPFEDRGASDWMAREFFTGGLMPSVGLLRAFQDDMELVAEWDLDGTHYARTAEAWHANLLAREDDIVAIVGSRRSFQRWRVFFLACAEMFGYARGREWRIAHYLFAPRGSS